MAKSGTANDNLMSNIASKKVFSARIAVQHDPINQARAIVIYGREAHEVVDLLRQFK
jgi:hypothetical protein